MRPVEFPVEAIIEAGQALQAAGRNVTGFALRQKVGGGNPTRLRQVWDEHLANNSVAQAQPVAELPVEVAEEVANVTKALTERIATLAVELNDKAVKAAERRVAEVLRTAGEQREQAERELADAATTVDDLEGTLNETKAIVEVLTGKLAESQAHGQAQAVELAQLRERLAAAEQTIRTETEKHTADLARANETSERLRAELDALRRASATELGQLRERLAAAEQTIRTDSEKHASDLARADEIAGRLRTEQEALRKASAAELDQARVELAGAKAAAESDLRHSREEARHHQLALEQVNGLLAHVREELEQARQQGSEAREESARLRGQLEANEAQRAELMKVLAERPVAVEKRENKGDKPVAGKGPK